MKIPRMHIFVCQAQYCKENNAEAVYQKLREVVRQMRLGDVTVTSCGSIGLCDVGPALVVYPEGIWYVGVKPEDLGEIVEKHLVKGQPVARLRFTPDHPQEQKRQAFYNKLLARQEIPREELVQQAKADGFPLEWLEGQIHAGFLEALDEEGASFRVSGKGRGRYGR